MELDLDDEQRMLLDSVRRFAESELATRAYERDKREQPDERALVGLAELGVLGAAVSEAHGGLGLSYVTQLLLIETIASHDASVGYELAAHAAVAAGLGCARGLADAEVLLTGLAAGKSFVSLSPAAPLSALQAGFDLHVDGGTVSGNSAWVAHAQRASHHLVLAEEGGVAGALLIPRVSPGVTLEARKGRLGLRGVDLCELALTRAKPTSAARLPPQALAEWAERVQLLDAAVALGLGRASLEQASRYALDRHQFGKAIAELQAIQWLLADMAVSLDAARLLLLAAADRTDRGAAPDGSAAKARTLALEAATKAAASAVQIHGGNGYVREYKVERHLRDAQMLSLIDGTPDTARALLSAQTRT